MRKTLLTLAVSALPITSSPSLQLVCIATIVMGSLFLHAALLPYKTMSFNLTECALLATAALMTATVTGLTAYDHYWGRTMFVEYLMVFSVVNVATLTCAAMIFLIAKALKLQTPLRSTAPTQRLKLDGSGGPTSTWRRSSEADFALPKRRSGRSIAIATEVSERLPSLLERVLAEHQLIQFGKTCIGFRV
eukprot:s1463_g7.t1